MKAFEVTRIGVVFFCGVFLLPGPLMAQWSRQVLELNAGWNAVFLEVQPEPNRCDDLFEGMPIASVWKKNPLFSRVQFIQNPDELRPEDPEWLVYFPAGNAAAEVSNLFILQGGESYLIRLNEGSGPITWTLKGRPVVKQYEWERNRLHLVGFPVASRGAPTFASYFEGSPAHQDLRIYRLDAQDRWEPVEAPDEVRIQKGHAYWVWADRASTYSGPLQPVLEQGRELDFGETLTDQVVELGNHSAQNRTISLQVVASESSPQGADTAMSGPVALEYFQRNLQEGVYQWAPLLEGEVLNQNLAPGESWRIRLGVRRTEMQGGSSQSLQAQATSLPDNATFQSLLRVTDNQGSELLLPVSARGLGSGAGGAASPYAGLWAGYAAIDHVSQPADPQSPDTPQPTASAFQFRLLVHVDRLGQARLLRQVLELWKEGTYQPDPADPSRNIIDEPGRFVLLTDDSQAGGYTGAALRDGVPVGRRFSSAAFSFSEPIAMSPAGAFPSGTLSCTITLDYDHPLNPFKHRYHPDHNNLDERYETKLAEGIESFTIIREIKMEFTESHPEGIPLAGWNDTRVGGDYSESITGLHKNSLHVSGTFTLERISRVPILNDSE